MSSPVPTQVTTHELWVEGRDMVISLRKTDPTTAVISWALPATSVAYDGAIVLLSEEKFSSINFPEDGTRYSASSNWAAPADNIDHAKVVAAFYGYFGDNTAQTSVTVTNLDPNKIYYASIHAASNVLQYYTIGVQSYPLESSRFEKSTESFAGSIPTASVPPTNPSNGQAYFDPTTNFVLVWNSTQSAWVQASREQTPSGVLPPVSPLQLIYNYIDSKLKFFNNGQWVECTPLNTRVKMGGSWVPANVLGNFSVPPETATPGDIIYTAKSTVQAQPAKQYLNVFSLGGWFAVSNDLIQVQTAPAVWQNIVVTSLDPVVQHDPVVPKIGDFFYQITDKRLLVWDGSNWVQADADQEGTPTSDKIGIGTDGSYDERLRLMKILKQQLGYPQRCVELTEEQFNIAIDNALDEFRRRADNAYKNAFLPFTLVRGQSIYYLNDPRAKTDKIVNVIKINRINNLGLSSIATESSMYAQAFYNQIYNGGNVDLVSVHLMGQLSESFEKIFAGNLMFTWDEASRQLMVMRKLINAEERVVLEVAVERTEQELLLDRWAKQWLQGWAESELLEMLGLVRSKYGSLPGPNGGITLNGDQLLNLANEKQADLLRQLTDYEAGNGIGNFGNTMFLIG